MNPVIDVLNFMLPSREFMKSFHLVTPELSPSMPAGETNQILTWHRRETTRTGWIYYVKTNSGYPWDIYYYNSNQVYWVITPQSASWTDPSSYQAFTSSSWPQGRGGIAWSPRFLEELPAVSFLTTEDTRYQTFQAGQLINSGDLGAPGVALVQGPYALSVGRLGQQAVVVQTYQWADYMEVNWFAQGLGKVRHRLYELQAGVYQLTEDETFDQRVAGGSVEPLFRGELPGPEPPPPPPAVITVTIQPGSASLAPGATQQFTATVANATNPAVSWQASGGAITPAGLFTAPQVTTAILLTVTATSVQDPTKSATVNVAIHPVVAPPITVTISPTSVTLDPGQSQTFTAIVTGSTNQTVTWTASLGTITSAGVYTAPATVASATTATITATAVADTSISSHTIVTLNPSVAPPPSQLDLLQWHVLSTRATQHLVGDPNAPYEASWLDTDAGYPANYPKNTWWSIKNKLGHPWDVSKYDNSWISHWLTENGDSADQAACQSANGTSCWLYNRAYKRKLIPQQIMPRYFTPGTTITVDTQAPNAGNRTTNCESTFTVVNLGPSRCITTGPFKISWGGSIDQGTGTLADGPNYDNVHGVDTIKNSYQYSGSFSGGFSDIEETYFVLGFGRVAWYHYQGGVFKQKTVNTTLASGGHPTPDFPCGPGKSWFV